MKRVKVQEPENYIYSTDLRVRISDLNYGNHLSNDAFLRFAHEARMRFFASMAYTELDIGGVGTIMADCEIQFLGQGYFGDEIKIRLGISAISRHGFDLIYKMENVTTTKSLAIIKTAILGFDYEENKVKSIPKEFWNKVNLETSF